MCGVCEGSEPIELLEKWNGSEPTCAEKETTNNVTRNATTGGGLNALNVSQLQCHDKVVHPPQMCIPLGEEDMTVILAENTSTSSENVALLLHTANQVLSAFVGVNPQVADPYCSQKTVPACPPETDTNAFYQYFVSSMVAAATVICDSVYTYCDVKNLPRLACPTAMCCSMCNGVVDVHSCPYQKYINSYSDLVEGILRNRKIYEDILARVNDDVMFHQRVLDALSWALLTAKDSYQNYSSWDSCMQHCEASAIARLSWYAQSPDCLSNEDRRHEKETKQISTCQCDISARTWLDNIKLLHWFAFCGAYFLFGLQVFVALFWDHEDVNLRLSWSCACDLFRAKEQWFMIVASALLIGCVQLQQTSIALGQSECRFHNDKEPLEYDRLMFSWTALTIVMVSLAMFTLIMPAVKWQMHENYAKHEAYNYNALKEKRKWKWGCGGRDEEVAHSKALLSHATWARYWCITCLHKMSGLNLAYDELFSYERGNFFMLLAWPLKYWKLSTRQVSCFRSRMKTLGVDYEPIADPHTEWPLTASSFVVSSYTTYEQTSKVPARWD